MKLLFYYVQLLIIFFQTTVSPIYILTFGKGENCAGYNICNISEDISFEKEENQARVSIRLRDGRIEFEFFKNSISDKAFLKFFSTGFFVLDTDYTLPYVVSNALSLKNKVIKAGKYKVIATSDTYVLSF